MSWCGRNDGHRSPRQIDVNGLVCGLPSQKRKQRSYQLLNLPAVRDAGNCGVSDRVDFRKCETQKLIKGFHHQEAVFAVVVVFCDALDDCVVGLLIEALSRRIADSHLKHDSTDLFHPQSGLDILKQLLGDTALFVLRCDSDGS